MRYTVLDRFKAKTKAGERDILPGQVVALSPDLAASLIEAGKIAPDTDAAPSPAQGGQEIKARTLPPYKVIQSKILDDTVLIVNTDEEARALKVAGIEDVVYSMREAKELNGLLPVSLKAYHLIKRVFPGARIERGQDG